MDPLFAGNLGIAIMSLLIVLGMRIAFATALVGILGIGLLKGWGVAFNVSGYLPHGIVAHYSLSVIPLFIIMGYFAYFAGLTKDAFYAASQWFGHLSGGLAIATTYGCAGFGACTGSSPATAAVMGKMAISEMIKYGYNQRLAAGAVAAGGTLAILIPPSVPLVVYGLITDQSVGVLLIAGLLPGILTAFMYALMIQIRVKLNPSLALPLPRASWKAKIASIFVRFLALTGLPVAFSKAILAMPAPSIVILLGILAIFVFLGMFLEIIGMMLLALPVIFPAVIALGFNPIWFGVIVVKMGEICLITPPVGLNVYVVNSVAPDIPIHEIFIGITPFLITDFVTLALLIIFPQITLFLPSLMLAG